MRDPRRAHDREDPLARDRRERAADAAADEQEARDADPARAAVGMLQRSAGNAAVTRVVGSRAGEAGREVATRLIPGAGRRLPPALRASLEERLCAGLGAMRVHTGSEAGRAARAHGARAYAAGGDVVFAEGAFDPGSHEGRALIAHEAAHVVQQRGSAEGPVVGPGAEAAESEARDAGRLVAAGRPAERPAAAGAALQGDVEEPAAEEWAKLARVFEADAAVPGPMVLAEGLHVTATRVEKALERTAPLTRDDRDRARLKRAGDDLEHGEKELPDLVHEVEARKLPDVTGALEEMDEALDEIERIPKPSEERARHSRELAKVAKGAARLGSALPSGPWSARLQAVGALEAMARDLGRAPVAGAGGEGDEEGGGAPAAD